MHLVLVNHLEGLSLPRNYVVRLTDYPNMTIAVYCGRTTPPEVQSNVLNPTPKGSVKTAGLRQVLALGRSIYTENAMRFEILPFMTGVCSIQVACKTSLTGRTVALSMALV